MRLGLVTLKEVAVMLARYRAAFQWGKLC